MKLFDSFGCKSGAGEDGTEMDDFKDGFMVMTASESFFDFEFSEERIFFRRFPICCFAREDMDPELSRRVESF